MSVREFQDALLARNIVAKVACDPSKCSPALDPGEAPVIANQGGAREQFADAVLVERIASTVELSTEDTKPKG
jgi:hypothetical protein